MQWQLHTAFPRSQKWLRSLAGLSPDGRAAADEFAEIPRSALGHHPTEESWGNF